MAFAPAVIDFVPCANFDHEALIAAIETFERKCLPDMYVANVEMRANPGRVPCRWMVSYKFRDCSKQYLGGQFARQLAKRFYEAKPTGTRIMNPGIALRKSLDDVSYVVEYGVMCACNGDPFFGEPDEHLLFYISELFSH